MLYKNNTSIFFSSIKMDLKCIHQHFKSVQQRDDELYGGPSYRAEKCSAEYFEP